MLEIRCCHFSRVSSNVLSWWSLRALYSLLPADNSILVWKRGVFGLLGHVVEVFRWDKHPQFDGVVPSSCPPGLALLMSLRTIVLVWPDSLEGVPESGESPLYQYLVHARLVRWRLAFVGIVDESSASVVVCEFLSCPAFAS